MMRMELGKVKDRVITSLTSNGVRDRYNTLYTGLLFLEFEKLRIRNKSYKLKTIFSNEVLFLS